MMWTISVADPNREPNPDLVHAIAAAMAKDEGDDFDDADFMNQARPVVQLWTRRARVAALAVQRAGLV